MLPDILDLSKEELAEVAREAGLRPFACRQIYEWLYTKGATSFQEMTNLSQRARLYLTDNFRIGSLEPSQVVDAEDGTTKYLFRLADGHAVETVMIPAQRRDHNPRRTVCISTQVGCAMGCTFCRTGTMGLTRNLRQGEILEQIRRVRSELVGRGETLTNIVLMGMGEPLHNYQTVVGALRIMIDDTGMQLAARRITISTVGLAPAIRRLGEERLGVKLALSLHATTDATRQMLIPLAKKYPIDDVLDACHYYCRHQTRKGTRVTFEYLMLREVNDTPDDAQRLIQLASKVPCKVNLIPLNPYPGCPWERPEDERIDRFATLLRGKHLQVNVRHSRGRDILAACGQLATKQHAA